MKAGLSRFFYFPRLRAHKKGNNKKNVEELFLEKNRGFKEEDNECIVLKWN